MNKTQHISNNDVLGAPQGWDQNRLPCNALPITRASVKMDDQEELTEVVKSYWTPTLLELHQLMDGAKICLWVVGTSMPPVMLNVEY